MSNQNILEDAIDLGLDFEAIRKVSTSEKSYARISYLMERVRKATDDHRAALARFLTPEGTIEDALLSNETARQVFRERALLRMSIILSEGKL